MTSTPPEPPEYSGASTPPPPPSAPTGGDYSPPPGGGYSPPPGAGYPAPGAPAGQLSQNDERMWSMLAHLGGLLLGFIAPLVVMLVQGDKSAFVKRQSVEALNFQITLAIAYAISFVLMLVLIGFLLIFVVWIGSIVLMIMAGIAANRGEDYRYPVALRLVK